MSSIISLLTLRKIHVDTSREVSTCIFLYMKGIISLFVFDQAPKVLVIIASLHVSAFTWVNALTYMCVCMCSHARECMYVLTCTHVHVFGHRKRPAGASGPGFEIRGLKFGGRFWRKNLRKHFGWEIMRHGITPEGVIPYRITSHPKCPNTFSTPAHVCGGWEGSWKRPAGASDGAGVEKVLVGHFGSTLRVLPKWMLSEAPFGCFWEHVVLLTSPTPTLVWVGVSCTFLVLM